MRETLFIVTIMSCIVVFGNNNNNNNNDDDPYCEKTQLPFVNEAAASYRVHYFLLDCAYNYWKANTSYKAMPGFKAMWGNDGFLYNKSTTFQVDGERCIGYKQWRARTVACQNVLSFGKAYDINIYNWSAYEVFASYKMNVALLSGTHTVVKAYYRSVWFKDDSGIVKNVWGNSTSGIFGETAKKVMQTTQFISTALGYLNEDDDNYYDYKYIGNPIRFIFLSLFCVLTVFVAVSVYVLLKCVFGKVATMRRYAIVDMDSITSSDEPSKNK